VPIRPPMDLAPVAAFFGYSTNYLVAGGGGVIVDVEARAPTHPRSHARATMIERSEQASRSSLTPDRRHATAPAILGWLVQDKQSTAHPGVGQHPSGRRHLQSPDFSFGCRAQPLRLSAGKSSNHGGGAQQGSFNYRASQFDCVRALKDRCCPNALIADHAQSA